MNNQQKKQSQEQPCYQCEGKGYTELRDCAGEIQRTQTCSFCEGKGYTNRSKLRKYSHSN